MRVRAKAKGRGDSPGMEGTARGPVAHRGAALMQGRPSGKTRAQNTPSPRPCYGHLGKLRLRESCGPAGLPPNRRPRLLHCTREQAERKKTCVAPLKEARPYSHRPDNNNRVGYGAGAWAQRHISLTQTRCPGNRSRLRTESAQRKSRGTGSAAGGP